MTKAQQETVKIIENFLNTPSTNTFAWKDIVEAVNISGAKVKNWIVVRNAIQPYINNGSIKRTADKSVEEYEATKKFCD
jgi:hypothetical protein